MRLVRKEQRRESSECQLVIPVLEIFDIINESQRNLGHLGKDHTYIDPRLT